MTTNNPSASLGVLDFRTILLNPEHIASAFDSFVKQGSVIHHLSIDDIKIRVHSLATDSPLVSIADGLAKGANLFDTVAYFSLPATSRPAVIVDQNYLLANVPTLASVARAVFIAYFFLLTQARYPGVGTGEQLTQMPSFIVTILGDTRSQAAVKELLATFDITKFNPAWIRNTTFRGMGQEALSRFGLGVAGYRLITVYKHYKIKDGVPQNLVAAVEEMKRIADTPFDWDVHPITRHPDVLSRYGNINKNSSNLILEVFDDATIDIMLHNKALYAKPVAEPSHTNYKSWGEVTKYDFTNPIFPSSA